MSFPVEVRGAAERDIEVASDWYAVAAPEQVNRFEDEIDRALARLVAHPLVPETRVAGARRIHLWVFPYELWYLVHEDLELIEVVALVHDRQDPSTMLARLDPTL